MSNDDHAEGQPPTAGADGGETEMVAPPAGRAPKADFTGMRQRSGLKVFDGHQAAPTRQQVCSWFADGSSRDVITPDGQAESAEELTESRRDHGTSGFAGKPSGDAHRGNRVTDGCWCLSE